MSASLVANEKSLTDFKQETQGQKSKMSVSLFQT